MKFANLLYEDHVLGTVEWNTDTKQWKISTWSEIEDPILSTLYLTVYNRINHWVKEGKLPYPMPREEMYPWEDDWWDHVRKFLIHAIKLGPTETLNASQTENEGSDNTPDD